MSSLNPLKSSQSQQNIRSHGSQKKKFRHTQHKKIDELSKKSLEKKDFSGEKPLGEKSFSVGKLEETSLSLNKNNEQKVKIEQDFPDYNQLKNNGLLLDFASEEQKNNETFVKTAIQQNYRAYAFASSYLRRDPVVIRSFLNALIELHFKRPEMNEIFFFELLTDPFVEKDERRFLTQSPEKAISYAMTAIESGMEVYAALQGLKKQPNDLSKIASFSNCCQRSKILKYPNLMRFIFCYILGICNAEGELGTEIKAEPQAKESMIHAAKILIQQEPLLETVIPNCLIKSEDGELLAVNKSQLKSYSTYYKKTLDISHEETSFLVPKISGQVLKNIFNRLYDSPISISTVEELRQLVALAKFLGINIRKDVISYYNSQDFKNSLTIEILKIGVEHQDTFLMVYCLEDLQKLKLTELSLHEKHSLGLDERLEILITQYQNDCNLGACLQYDSRSAWVDLRIEGIDYDKNLESALKRLFKTYEIEEVSFHSIHPAYLITLLEIAIRQNLPYLKLMCLDKLSETEKFEVMKPHLLKLLQSHKKLEEQGITINHRDFEGDETPLHSYKLETCRIDLSKLKKPSLLKKVLQEFVFSEVYIEGTPQNDKIDLLNYLYHSETVKHKYLKKLSVTAANPASLIEIVKNCKLKNLWIANSSFPNFTPLLHVIISSQCDAFELDHCQIGKVTLPKVLLPSSSHIRFDSLKCEVTTLKGLIEIISQCDHLQSLSLKNLQLSPVMVAKLAEGLSHKRSLREIICTQCEITDEGAKSFMKVIAQNKSFKSIDLASNPIGDEGGKALLEALTERRFLLYVDKGQMSDKIFLELEKYNRHNPILEDQPVLKKIQINPQTLQYLLQNMNRISDLLI